MTPYNAKPTRALRWSQNNAPNITSLLEQKEAWYNQFHESFWSNWERDVFNIDTATPFGLTLWCNILGVSTRLFNFDSRDASFAFGKERENFVSPAAGQTLENRVPYSFFLSDIKIWGSSASSTFQIVEGVGGAYTAARVSFSGSGGMHQQAGYGVSGATAGAQCNLSLWARNTTANAITLDCSVGYNGSSLVVGKIVVPANSGWARYDVDVKAASPYADNLVRIYCTTGGAVIELDQLQVTLGNGVKPFVATSGSAIINKQGSTGGNFAGAGSGLTNIDDVRTLLKLRYITLIGNGRTSFVNRMLNYIFNKGKPWNMQNKEYAYVVDKSCAGIEASAKLLLESFEGLFEYPQNQERKQYFAQNANGMTMGRYSVTAAAEVVRNITAPDNTNTMLDFSMKAGSTGIRQFKLDSAGPLEDGKSTNSISFYVKRTLKTYITKFRLEIISTVNGAARVISNSVFTVTGQGTVQSDSAASIALRTNAYGDAYFCAVSVPNEPGTTSVSIRLTMLNNNGDDATAAAVDISGLGLWGFMLEQVYRPGIFLYNALTTAQTYSAVSVDSDTGAFTLPQALKSTDKLYWTGRWKFGGADKQLIGPGDGSKVLWNLPNPSTGTAVTKDYYFEIRIGANVKISTQFVALLNDRNNGLIPQNTGVSYLVVKET